MTTCDWYAAIGFLEGFVLTMIFWALMTMFRVDIAKWLDDLRERLERRYKGE
jgi:hypothetical protein